MSVNYNDTECHSTKVWLCCPAGDSDGPQTDGIPIEGRLRWEKVLMLKAAQSTPRLLVLFSPDPFPVLVQHHVTVA